MQDIYLECILRMKMRSWKIVCGYLKSLEIIVCFWSEKYHLLMHDKGPT